MQSSKHQARSSSKAGQMQPIGSLLLLLALAWAAPERRGRDGTIVSDINKDLQALKDAKKAGTL